MGISMANASNDMPSNFGPLLKFWRNTHELSQEALALSADSSTRHISCLENGKSHPSRAMIDKLSEVLNLGERDSCYLQLAAGYLPAAKFIDFHDPKYNWLKKAMILTLKAMDPFPAALMDRYGKLLMVNKGWIGFHRQVASQAALEQAQNHYEFLFAHHQEHTPSEVKKNTLALILMAMKQESLLSQDSNFADMFDALLALPDVPSDWEKRAASLEPQASFKVQMDINHVQQNFYSVSQMVGALGPTSFVSEPRLIINTLYPENPDLDLSQHMSDDLSHPLLAY
jgi:transcriptional regulator with XRE-family HTH domain